MPSLFLLGGFVIAATTALFLTPLVRRLALRMRWVDAPDGERKLHTRPIPHVGGIVLLLGIGAGLAYFALLPDGFPSGVDLPGVALLLGALFMFSVGLWDDVFGLDFRTKLICQVAVAYAMVAAGYTIDLSAFGFVGDDLRVEMLLTMPLTVLWIVGIINAVNLLDGLDGLAAGIVAIAFVSLAGAFAMQGDGSLLLVAAVVGAIVGFLVFNFNPASIFMGDSGSMLLGFMLATYAIRGAGHTDPLLALAVPVLAIGLPVLDTVLSIVRRVLANRSPFYADGDHIHHRVLRRAGSTRSAVLGLYFIGAVFGVAAVALALLDLGRGLALLLGVLVLAYALLRALGYPRARAVLRHVGVRYARSREARRARRAAVEVALSSDLSLGEPSGDGAQQEATEPVLD